MNKYQTVMQKKNEVVNALEKYTFNGRVYRSPSIPVDKAKNACASYACELEPEDILLLMDDSEFGDAQTGLIFSMKGIFVHEPYKIRNIAELPEIEYLQLNKRKLSKSNDIIYTFILIDDYNIETFTRFIEECKTICKNIIDINDVIEVQLTLKDHQFTLKDLYSKFDKASGGEFVNFFQEKYNSVAKKLDNINMNRELKEMRTTYEKVAEKDLRAKILLSFANILITSAKYESDDTKKEKKLNEGIEKLDLAIAKEIRNPSSIDTLNRAMQARLDSESDLGKKQNLTDTYISDFEILCTKYKNDSSVFIAYSELLQYLADKAEDDQQKKYYLNNALDKIISAIHIRKQYVGIGFSNTIKKIIVLCESEELKKDTTLIYIKKFRALIEQYSDAYELQYDFAQLLVDCVRNKYCTNTAEIINYLHEVLQIFSIVQKYKDDSFLFFDHWRDTLYNLFYYERASEGYRELLLTRAQEYANAKKLQEKEKSVNEILGDFFYEFRIQKFPDDDEKYVHNLAALYYQKAVEADNGNAKAWFGWGRSLHASAAWESAGQKADLLSQVADKYEKAEQCGFADKKLWPAWGKALYALAEDAKNPDDCRRLLQQACNKYKKFFEINSDDLFSNDTAILDYAYCLFDLSKIETDPDVSKKLLGTADSMIIKKAENPISSIEISLSDRADKASNPTQKKWLLGLYINILEQKIFKPTKKKASSSSTLWLNWYYWENTLDSLLDIISDPDEKISLLENSIVKCKKAAKSDHTNDSAWENWGNCLLMRIKIEHETTKKQKIINEYLAVSEKWHSYSADNPEMWIDWGRKYFELARRDSNSENKKRQLQESVAKYNSALALKPNAVIEQNCGYALTLLAYLEPELKERTKLLEEAVLRYEKAAHINSDSLRYQADWADALLLLAESEYSTQHENDIPAKAKEICEQALAHCPADNADAGKTELGMVVTTSKAELGMVVATLGRACLRQAILSQRQGRAEEAQQFFGAARGHFDKANESSKGMADYDSACLELALGNEAECRRLLFDSLEHRTLPMFERVMNDPQLASVRNADWFAEFVKLRLSKADWKVFTM